MASADSKSVNPIRARRASQWKLALAMLAAPMLMGANGCSLIKSRESLPPVDPHMSMAQLIQHVNANSERLHSWRCTDAKITTQPSKIIPIKLTLSAQVAVEREQKFRLRARSPFGDEADIGSNDERFWLWMRRNKPCYVYTAPHDQVDAVSQRMQIPFQPKWVMEALGVQPIDPASVTLQQPGPDASTTKLITETVSSSGQRVQREILINTHLGIVTGHNIFDAGGQLMARTILSEHRQQPSGVILPHRIDLEFPTSNTYMTIELAEIDVNPSDLSTAMWQLPKIPGSPEFDMGARLVTPVGAASRFRSPPSGHAAGYPTTQPAVQHASRTEQAPPWANSSQPVFSTASEAPPFSNSPF